MSEKRFTVMRTGLSTESKAQCPPSIPWSAIAPHEKQARSNHGQSLERLNERGGCSPREIYNIVHGLPWGEYSASLDMALSWLRSAAAIPPSVSEVEQMRVRLLSWTEHMPNDESEAEYPQIVRRLCDLAGRAA